MADRNDLTPLMIATAKGNEIITNFLCNDHGQNVTIRKDHEIAVAIECGNIPILCEIFLTLMNKNNVNSNGVDNDINNILNDKSIQEWLSIYM